MPQLILSLRNRQKVRPLNKALLRRLALTALHEWLHAREYELCFHFVDAEEMAHVNQQFLEHTGSTDVITFDYGEPLHAQSGLLRGEIFISIPDAVAQAKEFGTSWESETARYMIHGLLHLRGYDDLDPAARRIMKREENRLVRLAERQFPLQEIHKA